MNLVASFPRKKLQEESKQQNFAQPSAQLSGKALDDLAEHFPNALCIPERYLCR